jgi:hypothetical protein
MRRLRKVESQKHDHVVFISKCHDVEPGQKGKLIGLDDGDAIVKIDGGSELKIVDHTALAKCDPTSGSGGA